MKWKVLALGVDRLFDNLKEAKQRLRRCSMGQIIEFHNASFQFVRYILEVSPSGNSHIRRINK